MSNRLKILAICSDYKHSNIRLPGVEADRVNLYHFTQNTMLENYILTNPSKSEIESTFQHKQPNIVWFCGHGVLDDNKDNVYIISDGNRMPKNVPKNITLLAPQFKMTAVEFTSIVQRCADKFLFCVFDFCHSCTMIDVAYYYESGFFYKKLGRNVMEPGRANDPLIITISGCTDYDTTEEDYQGGFLTQRLLYVLRKERALSLNLLDILTPKSCISVNKIIDPNFVFFNF